MKKSIKILLVVCTIVLVVIVSGWVYLNYFFNLTGDCSRDAVKVAQSSDGHHVAQILLVNCGATSDYSTSIALESPSGKKAEFIVMKGDHSQSCELNWVNGNTLSVKCNVDPSELYVNKAEYDGVRMIYEIIK